MAAATTAWPVHRVGNHGYPWSLSVYLLPRPLPNFMSQMGHWSETGQIRLQIHGLNPAKVREKPAMSPCCKIAIVVITIGANRGRAARGRPVFG